MVHMLQKHWTTSLIKAKILFATKKNGIAVWTTPYTVSERKAGNGLRLNEDGLPGGLPYGRILIKARR